MSKTPSDLEKRLYKPLDDYLKALKKRVKEEFAPLYVSGFDQLNIVKLIKTTAQMYSDLDDFNRKHYRELCDHSVEWAAYVMGAEEVEFDSADFVNQYLKGYDPVTQYVYIKEADRKRMRLNESILAAKEYQEIVKLQKAVKKAADLWFTQGSQYALDIMLATVVAVFMKAGVKKLRWNTQQDDKVCGDCHDLDGKVFNAKDYPPPQHYGCRCFPTPVND